MNDDSNPGAVMRDLLAHREICRAIFKVVEREGLVLSQSARDLNPECLEKKNLLPVLRQSLNTIRQHRIDWGKRSPQEREREGAIPPLLREIQDLIMRIIVVDRENEQLLLRKGLIPASHLPHPNRQRPHYVAGLYLHQSQKGGLAPRQANSAD